MIKVLIADDQALIRESLQIILSAYSDIEVVGTVGDGKEVLDKLHHVHPDVILMDIRMPVMDGVLCTKAVKEQYPASEYWRTIETTGLKIIETSPCSIGCVTMDIRECLL